MLLHLPKDEALRATEQMEFPPAIASVEPLVRYQPALPEMVPVGRTERLVTMREVRLAHAATLDQVEADYHSRDAVNSHSAAAAAAEAATHHRQGEHQGEHGTILGLGADVDIDYERRRRPCSPPRKENADPRQDVVAEKGIELTDVGDDSAFLMALDPTVPKAPPPTQRNRRTLEALQSHDFSNGASWG